MEASEREKPLVKDLHEHIVCPLCRGYLIDATTLVECLHSFCRGCIVRRLSSGARACPVCGAATLPPLLPDLGLQRLVYLLVPGLFRSELECRRHFRLVNPQCPPLVPPLGALDLTLDDLVSLSLRELIPGEDEESKEEEQVATDLVNSKEASGNEEIEEEVEEEEVMVMEQEEDGSFGKTRYLKCPAGVTVRHLVRLLMLKRGWEDADGKASFNRIEMIYKMSEERKSEKEIKVLDLSWTLLDLACIFKWKREAPMKLFYRVVRKEETISGSKQAHSDSGGASSDSAAGVMEDIQRPPTPPPSPKQNPNVEAPSSLEPNQPEASPSAICKEVKTKKPRCEVTPVLRSPGPAENHTLDNPKTIKVARLQEQHHKCRKRRNKRVIAEITTTPREDLLKLKVRLTPCPPRITSSTSNAKEKLLQMRAVRREKIKNPERGQNLVQHSAGVAASQDQDGTAVKKESAETEETIEDIIDSIPDEVVRVAQNMNSGQNDQEPPVVEKTVAVLQMNETEPEKPKSEEVLRRLGLVAIGEASKTLQDKMKSSQTSAGIDYHREKLERQLRESKANRVRSLLAEKQMRDALKRIMSKSKEKSAGPKKGPPPLAPLTLKPSFSAPPSDSSSSSLKNETPLDLSSGANNNALDLSPCPPGSSGTSCKPRTSPNAHPNVKAVLNKSSDDRKTQDSNLRTLSDAAVSLISDKSPAGVGPRLLSSPAGSVAGKVALRIPQPHQRISGFGMKMKPNLGVRHIPNPQAFVASQYRNQRASFFNVSQQQPP